MNQPTIRFLRGICTLDSIGKRISQIFKYLVLLNSSQIICSSCIVMVMVLSMTNLYSNNLNITDIKTTNLNSGAEEIDVQFDISWDNSWRDATNRDAVWVFIKYKINGSTDAWEHATLNTTGHTAPGGLTISTPADGKGVFIYRDANGSGSTSFLNVELQWNFGVDGLTSMDNVDIKVLGIEMVFIPQGGFDLGDGQTTNAQLYGNFEADTSGTVFQVNSEAAITLGGGGAGSLGNNNLRNQFVYDVIPNTHRCGPGCLNGSGDDFNDTLAITLPAAFPKGYDGFYCMKYEMTQQQFVDMLNCSSVPQQELLSAQNHFFIRSGETLTGNRYGISSTGGVYSTTEQYLAMIYMDWIRAAAYADWSALRPMTELEFEKSCRGTDAAVVNEFAWGNANIDLSDNLTTNNQGMENENISAGYDDGGINGNCWVRASNQTMTTVTRIGIFASHGDNTGRVTSGSSFWGIMELSGHAWERAVSVGHSEGRKYTGINGDGELSVGGYANVVNWPGTDGGTLVDSNVGVGYRGGALDYPTPNLERNARTSSRRLASGYWNTVIKDDGGRFGRYPN